MQQTWLSAQVYKVVVHNSQSVQEGSCVCIGDDGSQSYFLTAAHVIRDADSILIDSRFPAAVEHSEYQNGIDLALLSLKGYRSTKYYPVAPAGDLTQSCRLLGHRNGGPLVSRTVLHQQGNWFVCSQQVCSGDSGGPIITESGHVVGIVNAIDQPRCGTNVYATTRLLSWLNQHCPKCVAPQHRPAVQIPPPQYTQPSPHPPAQFESQPIVGAIDYEKLADAIATRHSDKLRGPPGPAGQDGQVVQQTLPSRRFVIVDGGKVIDDKTYAPGQPVVIDIQRLSP